MDLLSFLEKNESNQAVKKLTLLLTQTSLKIKEALLDGSGLTGEINIYGEQSLKIDEYANRILIETCQNSKLVKEVASEEEGEILQLSTNEEGLGVTLDPLDGSSNVSTNLAVGTIVGLYSNKSLLSTGRNQIAAFYILYGPLTILVYANNQAVSQFVFDKKINKFILSIENLRIPEGKIMAPGGLRSQYLSTHEKFIQHLENEDYKIRYSGSGVADVHQVLHYGGIFMYPALKNKPEGKLRLLFEANPWSFIIEKAGGYCSNGQGPILDLKAEKLDQRVPLYIGSKNIVKKAEEFMKGKI